MTKDISKLVQEGKEIKYIRIDNTEIQYTFRLYINTFFLIHETYIATFSNCRMAVYRVR